MSTAASVDTLEALFRKVDSEVESIRRDLETKSAGDAVTVSEVASRLVKARQTFSTLKAELATLDQEQQQAGDSLQAELKVFSELFDQLSARVGPVPESVTSATAGEN